MAGRRRKLTALAGGAEREVLVEPGEDGRWRVVVAGVERKVDARRLADGAWSLIIDGCSYLVDVTSGRDGALDVAVAGTTVQVRLGDPRSALLSQAARRGRGAAGPQAVRAPMPGKVVRVLVKAGDRVTAGQGVAVVEAMKMENELCAQRDGAVVAVHVAEGRTVSALEPLVTIE